MSLPVVKLKLNRISTIQERDAKMMIREQMPGAKKNMNYTNYSES
jgi:hypothetical protein